MRGRAALAAAIGSLALLAAPALAQEPGPGEVGGPPTNGGLYESFPDLKPTSEVLVIGAGRSVAGRVEIVAYESRYGLCIDVWITRLGGSGSCGGDAFDPGNGVAMNGMGYSTGGKRENRFSHVEGFLSPEVAALDVVAKADHSRRHPRAIIAQPDAELAARRPGKAVRLLHGGHCRMCVMGAVARPRVQRRRRAARWRARTRPRLRPLRPQRLPEALRA